MGFSSQQKRAMEFHLWRINKIAGVVEKAGEENCTKPSGSSFGSLKGTVWHLAWAEEIWLIRCFPAEKSLLSEGMTTDEILNAWKKISGKWAARLESLQENEWQSAVKYKNLQGQEFENSREEIFSHFVDHASYHTGQFMAQARAIGLEPAACSMINFFRETGNI